MRTVVHVDLSAVCTSAQVMETTAPVIERHPEGNRCFVSLYGIRSQCNVPCLVHDLADTSWSTATGICLCTGHKVTFKNTFSVNIDPCMLLGNIHINIRITDIIIILAPAVATVCILRLYRYRLSGTQQINELVGSGFLIDLPAIGAVGMPSTEP